MCLSLRRGSSRESLLLLWEHECDWVFGRRMGSEVDVARYKRAFITVVRKNFTDQDLVRFPWLFLFFNNFFILVCLAKRGANGLLRSCFAFVFVNSYQYIVGPVFS